MAKRLQLRRGTTSQHSSFTGAEGEITVDTTNKTLRVHDGSTKGGSKLAKASELTGFQASDAELTAIAGLTSAADKGIQFTGSGTAGTYDLTAFAKTILDDADAGAVRTTIGAQASDADLTAIAGLTSAADKGIQFTGSGTAGVYDLTAFAKTILDDADAAAVRTTIGAGTGNGSGDAVLATDFQQWTGTQRAAVNAIGSTGTFNILLDAGNLHTITLTGGSTLTFKKDNSTALNADCIGISGTIFLTNPANAQAMAGHCKKASGVEIPATAGDYIIPYTVIAADKVLVDVIGPVS